MTAIIRREDRTLIEHKGKKRGGGRGRGEGASGAKESARSLIRNAAAPCEFHVNQGSGSLLAGEKLRGSVQFFCV